MRITLSPILVLIFFTSITYSKTSLAQEALDKKINLTVVNKTLEEILRMLSRTNQVQFIYNRDVIHSEDKLSFQFNDTELKQVLDKLLNKYAIRYQVYKNKIILIDGEKVEPKLSGKTVPDIIVTGKVIDEKNLPLIGVSVTIKGSTRGTITDLDGNFKISVGSATDILVFKYIGYVSAESPANANQPLVIRLQSEQKTLNDVVVIGYGTQKRSDLTGAVGSINALAIQQAPTATLEQALQGRISGVQIQQSSGQPGAGISIRVRGATSIAGGNEPLYVIDGIPQYNTDVRTSNILASINPSDIQSIEVLKDASSTAIYGSRGANGVVMVTTKSGVSGRNQVTLDSYAGFQTVRKKLNLMDGNQFIEFTKQLYTNSNAAIPADLATYPNANTNWQDVLLQTAFQQNHNLGFSGGSDKTTYFVSLGLLDQNGIVKNSNYQRGSLRFNLDAKLSNFITVQTHIFASRGIENGFVASDGTNVLNFGKSGIGSMLIIAPTVSADFTNGYANARPYTFSPVDVENPLAIANEALNKSTITRFQGGTDFKINIIKGLTNTIRIGYDYVTRRNDVYYPKVLRQLSSGIGLGQLGQYESLNLLAEDFLEYKREIVKDLNFEGIVGGSFQRGRDNNSFLQGSNFFTDNLKDYNFSAAGSVSKPQTDVIQNTIISAFSRVRLNYKDRYLLAGSIRRDGVSVFSINNKYGLFPTVSAGWNIHNEAFMSDFTNVSELKLRASYGSTGNPAIQPYQSLSAGTITNTGQGGGGAGLAVGLVPSLPNDNLKYETTVQTDIGLDLALYQGRFRGSIDYYNKKTSDLLATVQLPPTSGYNTIIDNVGSVRNRGVELSLGTDILSSADIRWSVDVNISYNKNIVLKTKDNRDLLPSIANDASGATSIIRVGLPLSSFYGPQFNGINANGKQTWVDRNNDGAINANDYVPLGSPYPTLTYGFNTSFKYKRLTLSSNWAGVHGNKINNITKYQLTLPTPGSNRLANIAEYNPKSAIGDLNFVSDRFIESGAYFRMKNIRLDYKFNAGNSKVIKNAGVYISGQNLITFTKYTGYDPEVNAFSGNDIRQGVDIGSYPSSKSYTLGLSLTF